MTGNETVERMEEQTDSTPGSPSNSTPPPAQPYDSSSRGEINTTTNGTMQSRSPTFPQELTVRNTSPINGMPFIKGEY